VTCGRIARLYNARKNAVSNGVIELYEHKIVMKRGSGCLNPFSGSGDKQIMIADITSIEYRAAEKHKPGFIQFSFLGGQESKDIGGRIESDENTVMFNHKQQPAFAALRQALEEKMVSYRLGRTGVVPQASTADKLSKLAALRERGVINDQEFEQQKRRVLGG